MTIKERFPGICRAALSIAYDNGGINRYRSEDACIHDLGIYLSEYWLGARHSGLLSIMLSRLITIDKWLSQLSDEALDTVCNGEETEANDALVGAPCGTGGLLNGIFEYV